MEERYGCQVRSVVPIQEKQDLPGQTPLTVSHFTLVWATPEREVSVKAENKSKKLRRKNCEQVKGNLILPAPFVHVPGSSVPLHQQTIKNNVKMPSGVLEQTRWQLFSQFFVIFMTDICWEIKVQSLNSFCLVSYPAWLELWRIRWFWWQRLWTFGVAPN